MAITVAIPVAGEMGAGVGQRLVEHGAVVRTMIEGRSGATVERARRAGMDPTDAAGLAQCDIVLSIVPPGIALETAMALAPYLSARKPLYVDCNAVSPETARAVAAAVADTGAPFCDGGIIGGPPRAGEAGPAIYVSGAETARTAPLAAHGLDIRIMAGEIGAASALKMCYGGLTKGLTALAAAMLLAAERGGVGADLRAELERSQPELWTRFGKTVPGMYPKAYRWVAEMEEIGRFLDGRAEAGTYEGAAGLYARLAADYSGDREEIAALDRMLAGIGRKGSA